MNDACLLARVRERPGALERLIGMVRRRAFAVRRLSIATAGEGVLEVVLRVDESRTPAELVRTALLGLVDVLDVDTTPAPPRSRPTRELLLARLRASAGSMPDELGARVVADGAGGTVLELTGSPDEVDAALAQLREGGIIAGFVRSGELAVPLESDPEPSERHA